MLERREMLAASFYLSGLASVPPALALEACPKNANNCYSTASSGVNKVTDWTWPAGTSRTDAIEQLNAVLEQYPQVGQEGVDEGGWKLVDDRLAESGYQRREFFSSGKGNFAKFFNGGKPFIDDFEVAVEDAKVCVRSSSRVGDSDFGVNAKRLNFIAKKLQAKGWEAKGVAN